MSLNDKPIPSLINSQLSKFSLQSIRAKKERLFNPKSVLSSIKLSSGKMVYGVDIGGNKIISAKYITEGGELKQAEKPKALKSQNGQGYLGFLEKVVNSADEKELALGIGFAGKVEDNIIIDNPNVRIFSGEIKKKYDGDFRNFYPKTIAVNDAITGLMSGSIEAIKKYPQSSEIVFVVNGSGMNTSVLKNNEIWSMESGHVELDPVLNKNSQQKECGMFGAKYVCLENVAATKAGVEDLWLKITGDRISGEEVSRRLKSGNTLATDLLENSVLVTAHMIAGVIKTFGLLKVDGSTSIVCHGGMFYIEEYNKRLEQILNNYFKLKPKWLYTKDFSDNAGLDGAAIAALTI